ncbi:MAG: single-stranded DNA-binding protein [Ruminococcus sp.]|nr:single-stranded DNA-binding protein [Ruminococcus sp.]
MNNVVLVGRFTRDPDVRYTDGGTTIARFSLAVDRRFKSDNGPTADFPNCVAFGKTAEFIEKYFRQGMRIGVQGRIQTGSYENQEGAKVYTTDVVVENCEFVESKAASEDSGFAGTAGQQGGSGRPDADGFMHIPDGIDDELPFN